MAEDSHTITRLLFEWRSGNKDAAARLMELVYRELHQMASRQMRRERGEHTLQTTALVHEAYIRLFGAEQIQWHDRAHFFAVARWVRCPISDRKPLPPGAEFVVF
jgi:RNA polymerase sigma factor (TIGR02999 family)